MDLDTSTSLTSSNVRPSVPAPADPRLSRPPRPHIVTQPLSSSAQAPTQAPISRSTQQRTVQTPTNAGTTSTLDSAADPGKVLGAEGLQDASTFNMTQIWPTLSSLIESQMKINTDQIKKGELQKETAELQRNLERARLTKSYPAAIEMLQHMKESGDIELRKINESLNKHTSKCQKLANDLQKHQLLPQPSTPVQVEGERLTRLEAEFKEIKELFLSKDRDSSDNKEMLTPAQSHQASNHPDNERISKLEAEIREIKQSMLSKDTVSADIGTKISQLSNSVAQQNGDNKSLQADQGRLETRIKGLERWKDEGLHGQTASLPPSLSSDLTSLSLDIKAAQEKAMEAEKKVAEVCGNVSAIMGDLHHLKSLPSAPSAQEPRGFILDIQTRLRQVEAKGTDTEGLQNNVRTNTTELRGLQAKSDALYSVLRKQLSELEERIQKLMGDFDRQRVSELGQDMRKTQQATSELGAMVETLRRAQADFSRGFDQRVNGLIKQAPDFVELSGSVNKFSRTSDALVTAVRSLETRYSNINSEHLVKHMAHAMQEMYPSTQQLYEQLESLKGNMGSLTTRVNKLDFPDAFDKLQELQTLPSRVTTLETVQKTHSEELTDRLNDLTDLKCEFEGQVSAFVNLDDGLTEEMNKFSVRIGELQSQLQSQDQSVTKITTSFTTYQDMLEELKNLGPVENIRMLCENFQTLRDQILPRAREVNAQFESYLREFTNSRKPVSAIQIPQANGSLTEPRNQINSSAAAVTRADPPVASASPVQALHSQPNGALIEPRRNQINGPAAAAAIADSPVVLPASPVRTYPIHGSTGLHIKSLALSHSSSLGPSSTDGVVSRKRNRQVSLSDDDRQSSIVSQDMSGSSAPSASEEVSRKKKKNKRNKRKERHQQSQLE
ncbi:uncharacterized protein N7459_004475 [Penicillium hispanicum]|uniref:uncharacterized protein n=1 Tax=Penicillium hispanicum TaxID=1080232 RepID=UPI0025425386|nr:uncharacterized protein N7459_004475 [Penicillium hispanicum]KAJ5584675.1 hypothetical protein N7459_004475 [Penicillium hispanicum]